MIWAGFQSTQVGPIVEVKGNLTAARYVDLLGSSYLPFAQEKLPAETIYQQDNCPSHRSRLVTVFFQRHNIRVLDWSS